MTMTETITGLRDDEELSSSSKNENYYATFKVQDRDNGAFEIASFWNWMLGYNCLWAISTYGIKAIPWTAFITYVRITVFSSQ